MAKCVTGKKKHRGQSCKVEPENTRRLFYSD